MKGSFITKTLMALRGLPTNDLTLKGFLKKVCFVYAAEEPYTEFVIDASQSKLEIFWNFHFQPVSETVTLVSTETRVRCLTPESKRRFAVYWFFVRPFSSITRMEILRLMKRNLECTQKFSSTIMNMQLQSGITQLEDRIEYLHAVNERVSSANVGWHIAHTCLATERIIGALQQSDPGEYRGKFNWIKSLVLLTRRIPRGRGKAPKSTLVHESISAESLHERIAAARAVIAGLGTLKADHHFLHPYFGQMNLKGTVKFLDIHIQHHLKIIDEIIKKQ